MAKVLVVFSDNWADEMDIDGFQIFEKEDWDATVKRVKSFKFPVTIGFGTNEDNVYDDAAELLGCYTVKKLTDDEAKTITKLFGVRYGNFRDPGDVEQDEEDEEYGYDEEDED